MIQIHRSVTLKSRCATAPSRFVNHGGRTIGWVHCGMMRQAPSGPDREGLFSNILPSLFITPRKPRARIPSLDESRHFKVVGFN